MKNKTKSFKRDDDFTWLLGYLQFIKFGKVTKCTILNTFNLVVFKPSVGVIITRFRSQNKLLLLIEIILLAP